MTGNGFASQGSNFGIGLVDANDDDNVIVDNTVVGNANGIVIVTGTERNLIAGNVVVGNPPVQVAVNNPGTAGFDIRNLASAGSSTLDGNVCLTTVNAPCSQLTGARRPGRPTAAR